MDLAWMRSCPERRGSHHQGAGFDVAVEGRSTGQLSGRIRGVDYIWARADWRIELDIRATLETDDGNRIALSGTGLATRF